MRYEIKVQLISFEHGNPILLTPFFKNSSFFPYCMVLALLSKISWLQMYEFISGLLILFCWYKNMSLTLLFGKFGRFQSLFLQKCFWGLSLSLFSFWYSCYVYVGVLHGILPFSLTVNYFLSLCSLDLNLVKFFIL